MAANTPPSKDSPFRQYKIRNVKLTGVQIGSGTYSIVEEAEISGAKCVAKRINEQLFPPGDTPNVRRMNVAEGCRRLNNLHHPNVVQFLGVHFPEQDSQIPTLLMEALDTSLHQYLRPKSSRAKPSIPLSFKISILHGVACGLAYLHGQLPPLIHGHLSAKKVLLDSAMVAKISLDVGVTVLPRPLEPSPYMPPEVVGNKSLRMETTDVFSMGILTVFTITEELPDDILAPTYTDESKGLVARSELERRANYMEKIYGQLRRSHPLVQLIEKFLSNMPKSRPSMTETFPLFRQARVETPDPLREQTKAQVMQESAGKSQEIVRIRSEFERHTLELRDQIKGLLQGMAKLREMLPREEDDEPREVVNEKEIAYIVTFLEGIRASDLGLALGIETHTLEAIALDNRHNEGKRRVAVLTEWVTNHDNPTWASLVDALSTIGQKRMADSIRNDKDTGLQMSTATADHDPSDKTESMEAEKPLCAKKSASGSDADLKQLEVQLRKAKQKQEKTASELAEKKERLAEVSERCESLETELEEKGKKMKEQRIELQSEVRWREETTKENDQLQVELERLRQRYEKEVKTKNKEIDRLKTTQSHAKK